MRKLYGDRANTLSPTDKGGDMHEMNNNLPDDYLPLELERNTTFSDPYTEMQATVYAHISTNPDRDIPLDELVEIAAKVDRNDVRNLVFGVAVALRNIELIEFNASTLTSRMRNG